MEYGIQFLRVNNINAILVLSKFNAIIFFHKNSSTIYQQHSVLIQRPQDMMHLSRHSYPCLQIKSETPNVDL